MKLKIDSATATKMATSLKERLPSEGDTKEYSILIVDDEEANIYALSTMLQRDYNVIATTSPEEAYALATSPERVDNPIDIIITDQRMPMMSGTQLLSLIVKTHSDNIRMILTGYTDSQDLITCINNGLISRYIMKPINGNLIHSTIQEAITQLNRERTLAKIVPKSMLERLYAGSLEEARPGKGIALPECTILFLDIIGFTELSQSMDAEDLFKMLNSFLRELIPIIVKNGGFVDKFLGDGLMAIFDMPGFHGMNAATAAASMVTATRTHNAVHRSEPAPAHITRTLPRTPIEIGIGIHSGPVMMGTVGDKSRIDFTVLGNTVNLASRIESLTRYFGVEILIDRTVMEASENVFGNRSFGKILLRGTQEPIELFELYDFEESAQVTLKKKTKDLFEQGVRYENEGDDAKAKECFQKVLDQNPDDKACQYFLNTLSQRKPHLYNRKEDH